MQTLLEITIILIASLMATLLANRLAIPAVVGQLCVGILIGPSLLNLVHEGHVMHFLSEIGVILLMFLAGLEANLELLRKYFKPSLVVAISGVVIPMVAFYYVGIALGFPINTAVFYGLVFAATSVSITVEVLQEYQKVRTKIGAVILGAAVADDVLAVLLLSFFMSSAGASSHLVMQVSLQILFLVFLVFSVKLLVPKLYDWSQHIPYFEKETFLALLICLTWSLLAWSVGMSSVIGALFCRASCWANIQSGYCRTQHISNCLQHLYSHLFCFYCATTPIKWCFLSFRISSSINLISYCYQITAFLSRWKRFCFFSSGITFYWSWDG